MGPGCVKTGSSQERAELFSLSPSPNAGCQGYLFSDSRNRKGLSTRNCNTDVFTQPRAEAHSICPPDGEEHGRQEPGATQDYRRGGRQSLPECIIRPLEGG